MNESFESTTGQSEESEAAKKKNDDMLKGFKELSRE